MESMLLPLALEKQKLLKICSGKCSVEKALWAITRENSSGCFRCCVWRFGPKQTMEIDYLCTRTKSSKMAECARALMNELPKRWGMTNQLKMRCIGRLAQNLTSKQ